MASHTHLLAPPSSFIFLRFSVVRDQYHNHGRKHSCTHTLTKLRIHRKCWSTKKYEFTQCERYWVLNSSNVGWVEWYATSFSSFTTAPVIVCFGAVCFGCGSSFSVLISIVLCACMPVYVWLHYTPRVKSMKSWIAVRSECIFKIDRPVFTGLHCALGSRRYNSSLYMPVQWPKISIGWLRCMIVVAIFSLLRLLLSQYFTITYRTCAYYIDVFLLASMGFPFIRFARFVHVSFAAAAAAYRLYYIFTNPVEMRFSWTCVCVSVCAAFTLICIPLTRSQWI